MLNWYNFHGRSGCWFGCVVFSCLLVLFWNIFFMWPLFCTRIFFFNFTFRDIIIFNNIIFLSILVLLFRSGTAVSVFVYYWLLIYLWYFYWMLLLTEYTWLMRSVYSFYYFYFYVSEHFLNCIFCATSCLSFYYVFHCNVSF